MSKCFICGNDATGVTGDSNVCFSCYSKPKESTLISRIQALEAQLKRYRDALIAISLSSQNTMGGNSTDLGRIARAALLGRIARAALEESE